jgi:hypothetical protein
MYQRPGYQVGHHRHQECAWVGIVMHATLPGGEDIVMQALVTGELERKVVSDTQNKIMFMYEVRCKMQRED